MTQTISSSGVYTFRAASPLRRLTPLILVSLFTIGLIFSVSRPAERFVLPIVASLLVFFLLLTYGLMSRARLEISSDGIINYSVGYKVHSSWGNIEGYGKRTLGSQTVESLILRQPGIEDSSWWRSGAETGADYTRFIPVGLYVEDWRSGELGALIKQYAPQAFDNWIVN